MMRGMIFRLKELLALITCIAARNGHASSLHLRDLLWLAALVALAVGWWLDHRRLEVLRGSFYLHAEYGGSSVRLRDETTGSVWRLEGGEWIKEIKAP
jgi:hypothetical protein